MEQLIQLGFEKLETPWKENLWQLKEDDFFMSYNLETKCLQLSQDEDDFLHFRSVKILKCSTNEIEVLLSIFNKNEKRRTVQERF